MLTPHSAAKSRITLVAVAACGEDGTSTNTQRPSQRYAATSPAATTPTVTPSEEAATASGSSEPSPASDLDARIQAYVDAVNAESLDGLASAFAVDGVVIDVSREIAGRAAIREWADNEVIGGSLRVLDIEPRQDGARLLVHWAPAGSDGWRAYYDFDVAGDGITRADLQYAD